MFLFIVWTEHASSQPCLTAGRQQDFIITERSEAEICGRTVIIDGFWINNYEATVDISVLIQKMSKPITGGYNKGDTIPGTRDDCKYHVVSVLKYGMHQKGKVKLSASSEVLQVHSHPNEFTMNFKEKYKFGDEEWGVEKVYSDSAKIVRQLPEITKTFYLKKNDVVWFGEYAFSVTSFTPSIISMGIVTGKIDLKKVRDYSYINFPVIPGEMINPPPEIPPASEELIIRKMKYYPRKKIDEEELKNTPVKFWVLKIFYYPRGIASPVIKITRGGKDKTVEYTGYKSFETEEEVIEFAKLNNIKDIILEEK